MNDVVAIEYGAKSTVSRWFDDYWTERERQLMPWVLVLILSGFILLGPPLLLWLVSFLPFDQLGNSGASLHAHQLLQLFAFTLATAVTVCVVIRMRRPSLIELSQTGIRKVWLIFGLVPFKGRVLPWAGITSVRILKGVAADTRLHELAFGTQDKPAALKLSLGHLGTDESRTALVEGISRGARTASIEPNVFEALVPQRGLSFTEIWLDALSAPPGRERLLPLTEGALLDARYKVIKRLGLGGQGTVYLAEDSKTNANVVLKETILPVYADLITRKNALEAFHKEAFALESVKHPNIVKFLGSFVCDHRAYLVLDFIEGKTMSETIIQDGPLQPEGALAFGTHMCTVLSVLHTLSPALVHRDFTPDNLMVTTAGELVLIDFAVAVADDNESADVAGKVAYMSPEQLKGKPTVQSDIYSLGCTLYFMLTGLHPEPLNECWPMLANDKVSKELNELVIQCTRLDMKERYQNVEAVKSALQALQRS